MVLCLRHGRVGHCQLFNYAYIYHWSCWFSGSNLADYYLKKGFKVSGNDNLVGGDLKNVDNRINFFKIDCENLEELTKAMKGNVVCHAAAYAHEGLSSFSPTLICSNNVTGSTSVFTAAQKIKLKELYFVHQWQDMEILNTF